MREKKILKSFRFTKGMNGKLVSECLKRRTTQTEIIEKALKAYFEKDSA